VLTDTDLTHSQ